MLVKVALVVLLLTSLLTAGMDDQQTIAEPEAVVPATTVEKAVPQVSEAAAGWADDFTPITFVSFR